MTLPIRGSHLRFLTLALVLVALIGPRQVAAATYYELDIAPYDCSTDITNLSIGDIYPNCTADNSSGVYFAATDNDNGGTLEKETAGGVATFVAGFGPGNWTLSEELASGQYSAKRVFCSYYAPDGSTVLADNSLGDSGQTAYLYVAGDANKIVCEWFRFNAPPPQTTGSVNVNQAACPAGFDGYSASQNDIAANCQDVSQTVTFTLTDSNGASTNATTPGAGPNLAVWTQIPSGALTITETQPAGYGTPRVFCGNSTATGTQDPIVEVAVSGTTASTELKNGYDILYCDWIDIPLPVPTATATATSATTSTSTPAPASTATIPPTSTNAPQPSGAPPTATAAANLGGDLGSNPTATPASGSLKITAFSCPALYDPLGATATPAKDCDAAKSMKYTLTNADGDDSSGSTNTSGVVTFSKLAAGAYGLAQTYPDGVSSAFIWSCTSNKRQITSPFEPLDMIGQTGAVQLTLVAGEKLSCDWFDVTNAPDVDLTVSVFVCQGQQASPNTCDPAEAGIEIDLAAVSGQGTNTTLTTGDNGTAEESVAAGRYDVSTSKHACFVQSDQFTSDGTLDLTGVKDAKVSMYLCGS